MTMDLRQQKSHIKWLVDEYAKVAPDEPLDTVVIPVPDGGEYRILNCKSALAEFKKRMRGYPAAPRQHPWRPPIKPTGKRVTAFVGGYSIPYVPKKASKLIETAAGKAYAGYYGHGWFSNAKYMVSIPKPKTKRRLLDPIDRMMEFAQKEARYLGPATFGQEIFCNPTGEPRDDRLHLEVCCGAAKIRVNPIYVDLILSYHSKAAPYLDEGVLYMLTGGEIVGIVVGMDDISS